MNRIETVCRHIRVGDLAKKYGVSDGAIRLWARKRIIPCLKIDRLMLFEEAEVEKALNRYKKTEVKPAEAK